VKKDCAVETFTPTLYFIAFRKILPAIRLRQFLDQGEVVAMDDLVADLVPEHARDIVRSASLSALVYRRRDS